VTDCGDFEVEKGCESSEDEEEWDEQTLAHGTSTARGGASADEHGVLGMVLDDDDDDDDFQAFASGGAHRGTQALPSPGMFQSPHPSGARLGTTPTHLLRVDNKCTRASDLGSPPSQSMGQVGQMRGAAERLQAAISQDAANMFMNPFLDPVNALAAILGSPQLQLHSTVLANGSPVAVPAIATISHRYHGAVASVVATEGASTFPPPSSLLLQQQQQPPPLPTEWQGIIASFDGVGDAGCVDVPPVAQPAEALRVLTANMAAAPASGPQLHWPLQGGKLTVVWTQLQFPRHLELDGLSLTIVQPWVSAAAL